MHQHYYSSVLLFICFIIQLGHLFIRYLNLAFLFSSFMDLGKLSPYICPSYWIYVYLCVSVYSYQYLCSSICPFYWSWFFTISYFLFYIIFIISLLSFYTSFIALYFIFTDIHNNVSVYINNDIFIFFMPQILSLLLFIDTAWVS